ncbi:MAG TPA: hypothetical protein VGL78_15915 [Solirubrobacteraceae bacterium]
MEPVAHLAALVGLRSMMSVDQAAAAPLASSGQRIAGRVEEFATRRAAILERDRFDAGHWLDEGGGERAWAVELPPPQTNP